MNRNYFYIIIGIAVFCLLLVFFSLIKDREKTVRPPDYVTFPVSPFKTFISGLGVVQATGGNIMLGAAIDRIVNQILVHSGQEVQQEQILITLQNDDLKAELEIQKAAYETAKVNYDKLKNLPRKEDLISANSMLKSSELELEQAKSQYEMVEGLQNNRALSIEEINRRLFNYQIASLKLDQAHAEAEKIRQGAWQPDLETARLQMLQAEAHVQRIQSEIEKTIIKSPIDGTLIEIKTHVGEYPSYPIAIVGNINELEVKVSINQFDAHYFNPASKAVAYLQGDPQEQIDLEFVRLIPYLVNKQHLANDVKEIVDTKVLQVIYRIKNTPSRLFVGQPMDVYIQTEIPS